MYHIKTYEKKFFNMTVSKSWYSNLLLKNNRWNQLTIELIITLAKNHLTLVLREKSCLIILIIRYKVVANICSIISLIFFKKLGLYTFLKVVAGQYGVKIAIFFQKFIAYLFITIAEPNMTRFDDEKLNFLYEKSTKSLLNLQICCSNEDYPG